MPICVVGKALNSANSASESPRKHGVSSVRHCRCAKIMRGALERAWECCPTTYVRSVYARNTFGAGRAYLKKKNDTEDTGARDCSVPRYICLGSLGPHGGKMSKQIQGEGDVFRSYPATRALASLPASLTGAAFPSRPDVAHGREQQRTVSQSESARIRILAQPLLPRDVEGPSSRPWCYYSQRRCASHPPSARCLSLSLQKCTPGLDAVIDEKWLQEPCLRAGGRRTSAAEHRRTAPGHRRPAAAAPAAAVPALLATGKALSSVAPAAPSMFATPNPLETGPKPRSV